MDRAKRLVAVMLAVVTMLSGTIPATIVKAENIEKKTYTVTFRAGNVGSFNVNASNTSGENIEVTANYIKFTVEKGESLSSTFDFISDDASLNAYFLNITSQESEVDGVEYIDTGYRLKDVSTWCQGAATAPVNRNTEYVLDYAKLVDSVKYMIQFVDAQSLEQIATPTIAYGNAGETIICSPLNIAEYHTDDAPVQIMLNAEDESENVVVFTYTYTGQSETVVEVISQYEPGDVRVETIVNEVEIPTPAVPVNVIDDNADDNQVAIGQEDQNITIEDEQVPLGAENDTRMTIEDEEVPLAVEEEPFMVTGWKYILVGAMVIVSALTAVGVYIKARKKKTVIPEKISEKIEEKTEEK